MVPSIRNTLGLRHSYESYAVTTVTTVVEFCGNIWVTEPWPGMEVKNAESSMAFQAPWKKAGVPWLAYPVGPGNGAALTAIAITSKRASLCTHGIFLKLQ